MFIRIIGGIFGVIMAGSIIFRFSENPKFGIDEFYYSLMGGLMSLSFIAYAIFGERLIKLFPSLGKIKNNSQLEKSTMLESSKSLIIGAIFIISFCSWWIFNSYQAQSWSQASGNILEAHCDGTKGGEVRHVKYEYLVASEKFTNDREDFINLVSDNCSSGYTQNQSVIVFYNPNDPVESVLINDIHIYAIIGLIAGFCTLAFGLFRMNKLQQ
jgi:hypothetical protein